MAFVAYDIHQNQRNAVQHSYSDIACNQILHETWAQHTGSKDQNLN